MGRDSAVARSRAAVHGRGDSPERCGRRYYRLSPEGGMHVAARVLTSISEWSAAARRLCASIVISALHQNL